MRNPYLPPRLRFFTCSFKQKQSLFLVKVQFCFEIDFCLGKYIVNLWTNSGWVNTNLSPLKSSKSQLIWTQYQPMNLSKSVPGSGLLVEY